MPEPWQILRHRGAAEAKADMCLFESLRPGLERTLLQECCSNDIFSSYSMENITSCRTAIFLYCLSTLIKASA